MEENLEIKKAIIPIAGLGTRFLPLSLVISKEFFPLADKPIIQHVIEEVKKSGINEIKYSVLTLNDFAGTVSFLSYLEHLPHFTEISKIILSAETQESSQKTRVHTGKVIGSFEGVFFVKPTP